jgi:hypothetical protein
MIGVGLCLRNVSVSTGERSGPVVRAVFRGSCHNKTLTPGLENIQVLDEIVQVRGRDVSRVRDCDTVVHTNTHTHTHTHTHTTGGWERRTRDTRHGSAEHVDRCAGKISQSQLCGDVVLVNIPEHGLIRFAGRGLGVL